jgi:kynurenine formamidase
MRALTPFACALLLLAAAACGTRPHAAARPVAHAPSADVELVDLSHTLAPGSPYIQVKDATFPFQRAPIATIAERGVYANAWKLTEHIGTHVDAPCHFSESAPCLDAIPLEDLFAHVVLIDLRARARADADAEVTLDDLARWEAAHGPIPARSVVLMSSGWDARWPSQARFANADAAGVLHFPGFSRAAIERLASRDEVLGIGVDTLSIDPGRDARYEGHRVLARTNKWALECLAHLARLPASGARLLVGAPKIELASGGPARVVAWVPRRHAR